MADAITWKCVSAQQLQRLAQCHSTGECKREIEEIFKINSEDKKQRYLADFYFDQYSFAREQHFQDAQVSVILGILSRLIDQDFDRDSSTTIESSFSTFKSLLLAHSVERSPKSVQLFSAAEFVAIVDSFSHSYFRHFQLYKRIFTPFQRVHLTQRTSECVQQPAFPRPLDEAFLHPQKDQPESHEAAILEGAN